MVAKQKIALIGYGHWGRKVFRYLEAGPQFELARVYFRSLCALSEKQIREKYGVNFTADIDDIWRDESIKSVFVATPVKTHFELTMAALRNNKHVLVEKPITLNTEEANQIKTLARQKNLKVLTDYIYTFSKGLQKARQIIRDGETGKIRSITMIIRQLGRFTDIDVYGVLASHCLAVLDMFYSQTAFEFEKHDLIYTKNTPSAGIILFRCEADGITGHIEVSLNCPQRDKRLIFYGEDGALIYEPDSQTPLKKYTYASEKGPADNALIKTAEEYDYDEVNNIARTIETFYEIITADKPDNLDMALKVSGILEKLSSAKNISQCS